MPPEPGPSGVIHLILPSDQMAVHQALKSLFAEDGPVHLPQAERGTAELVLAEVLNNIVEHAYSLAPGEIEVTIRPAGRVLECTIEDAGRPMPGGKVPRGNRPTIGDLIELPEGGFGWLLIRKLTRELRYSRIEGRNRLTFCLGKR